MVGVSLPSVELMGGNAEMSTFVTGKVLRGVLSVALLTLVISLSLVKEVAVAPVEEVVSASEVVICVPPISLLLVFHTRLSVVFSEIVVGV